MSSDFKDVLRERIEALVTNRLAGIDAAVESARQEVDQVISRLLDTVASATASADENAAVDQISAEIAAQIGQAAAESSRLSGDLALLRDSVVDIDSQQTQADVLNSLVERAYSFAPRAVLFVVKGNDAIAWAARGFDDELGDEAVRGLSVSLAADTLLGAVLNGQTTFLGEPGDQKDNGLLLDRLGSTKPERIAGIPLRVRSKTVGILYADTYDTSVGSVGIEALELLVHNAGIIVELASLRQRHAEPSGRQAPTGTSPLPHPPPPVAAPEPVAPPVVEEPAPVEEQPMPAPAAPSFEPSFAEPEPVVEQDEGMPSYPELPLTAEYAPSSPFEVADSLKTQETPAVSAEAEPEPESEQPASFWAEPEPVAEPAPASVEPDAERTLEPDEWPSPSAEPSPFEITTGPSPFEISTEPSPFTTLPGTSESEAPAPFAAEAPPAPSPFAVPEDQQPTVQWTPEPVVSGQAPVRASAAPAAGELTPEDEKLHNDARRFARLLVSEIKLYNEQQVAEGRMNGDLYERLKDDIDRSRQMYDKRVAAPVAARFDYFYDELVGTLAEGDVNKLGPECPGPTI